MEQVIRVQTQEELDACLRIRQKVFVEEQQVPAELEIDDWDASVTVCQHVLMKLDSQAVGAARYRPYPDEPKLAKLQRFAVLKEYRGTGLGRKMLEKMEQYAQQDGYDGMILDGQVRARPFYEKAGYAPVSEDIFMDAGIPHIQMVKRF
ncbi:GNAT family N-acetyltransferase [Marinicrinis sediminis]|uniref:GNAT family N-acetyltransferase n=1 Tax=Marinicrinis sediminis TaxID=1652465 RepID=A0ABW5R6U0_9BACL